MTFRIGLLLIGIPVVLAFVSCASPTTTPTATPASTLVPTSTPTPPPTTLEPKHTVVGEVYAVDLYQEAEDDASRFDLEYTGKWIRITGFVQEVESGQVKLVVDHTPSTFFTDHIVLKDLPQVEMEKVEVDFPFTATCKVGDYVNGVLHLTECY